MENNTPTCPIWKTPVESVTRHFERNTYIVLGSPRAGGDYEITDDAICLGDVSNLPPKQKAKLTTFLIESRRSDKRRPLVTYDLVEQATIADPLPVYVRAERLLRYLVEKANHVGQAFVASQIIEDVEALGWSESSESGEIVYFLQYLMKQGWLEGGMNAYLTITIPGHAHIGEQITKKHLSQCFVAMWFDDSMDDAYEKGIKKAVEDCGYTPLRIDRKPDVNKIDDEIIAEIRRSRFVVADFTHDPKKGVRGGVYFEAGFAFGLGLPVIYTCRKDRSDDLHFDTRQYHHILWETEEGLCKQLKDRIGARVS